MVLMSLDCDSSEEGTEGVFAVPEDFVSASGAAFL